MKGKTPLALLPLLVLLGSLAIAPGQAAASPKVWHNKLVVWVVPGTHSEAQCRTTFVGGIACAQNSSPYRNKFTYVNLKRSGEPFIKRGSQKFPEVGNDGRQIYPRHRSRWSNNGVRCKLNKRGGVKCSNSVWSFRLNPHRYLVSRVSGPGSIPPRPDGNFQRGPGPKFCPDNGRRTWNANRAILGRTLTAARGIARRYGCSVRVVRKDGKNLMVTADRKFNRINVSIAGETKIVRRIMDVA